MLKNQMNFIFSGFYTEDLPIMYREMYEVGLKIDAEYRA